MRRRVSSGTELELVQRHLDELIGLLAAPPQTHDPGFSPSVDLRESGGSYVVTVDLPGVPAAEIAVSLVGRELRISGRKLSDRDRPDRSRCQHMERGFGPFSVEVLLPEPVQPATARARLASGVLEITLPRLSERRDRVHSIPIASEEG